MVNPEEREWFERYIFETAGAELDRKLRVKQNRVCTGHGRCSDSLHRCGAVESPRFDCDDSPIRSLQKNWRDFMKADVTALTLIKNWENNI